MHGDELALLYHRKVFRDNWVRNVSIVYEVVIGKEIEIFNKRRLIKIGYLYNDKFRSMEF